MKAEKHVSTLMVLTFFVLLVDVDALQMSVSYRPIKIEDLSAMVDDGMNFKVGIFMLGTMITIPEDMKLVNSDGKVVVDEVCVGDRLKLLSASDDGEYWDDGGYMDSPPVNWVADAYTTAKKVLCEKQVVSTPMHTVTKGVAGQTMMCLNPSDPLYKDLTRQSDYPLSIQIQGGLSCSRKLSGDNISGLKPVGSGYYEVDGNAGEVRFDKDVDISCVYLFINPSGGKNVLTAAYPSVIVECSGTGLAGKIPSRAKINYPADQAYQTSGCNGLKPEHFKVTNVKFNRSLKVASPKEAKVELSVPVSSFSPGDVVRVLARNVGDSEARIVRASVSSGNLVSCDSDKIPPGGVVECLFSVGSVDRGVKADVSYEYNSCGHVNRATASKVLLESVSVKPKLVEEVYLMNVYGSCDNRYYACHQVGEVGYVGYKCMKTSSGFYTGASQRINLVYNLSSIPGDAVIGSAKLYINVPEISRKQNIQIYLLESDPEPVVCVPGGDICTKPYCLECRPIYDVKASLISSIDVNSVGRYSFDLTSLVNQRRSENKMLSLQIRGGSEDLWPAEGERSCNIENQWFRSDVSVSNDGFRVPYIEIVYRK